MREDIDNFADLLVNKNAVVYVCGSKAVAEEVR